MVRPHCLYILCAQMLRRVRLFVTLQTVVCQAPLPMGFSWQGCWSGVPFPISGDLPDLGMEPASLMSPTLTICVYVYKYRKLQVLNFQR